MGKRLSDNLSSLYIGAANRLKPKKAKRRIIAYVESYDDVAFWRSVFADFEDENHYFEVMLPSNKTLAKGKKSVLMNQLGSRLGQNMVACVDSDYDYLLQGATSTSRQINNSRFVFQTYAYAIENYQCYAESLHEACVMATMNDHKLIDFVGFMTLYSQIAYPLFIWSVWFYRQHNLNEFSLFDFCSYVRLDHVSVRNPEQCLIAMDKRVKRKLQELEKTHADALEEIESMKAEFTYLGVTPENTYLFIQGHHIMESVTMKVLIPVCNTLRREREEEIKHLAEHHTQFRNEQTSYERRLLGIDVVLSRHTGYKDCPVYQKLAEDIRAFLKRIS
ncbi:MAG: DUF4435 domain-containing protein [Bacteroidaceae bacterium]|nr:DUF4435 domain-containing protein [Bacteroidaceae bacterium]